jgi:hypothetical protein
LLLLLLLPLPQPLLLLPQLWLLPVLHSLPGTSEDLQQVVQSLIEVGKFLQEKPWSWMVQESRCTFASLQP